MKKSLLSLFFAVSAFSAFCDDSTLTLASGYFYADSQAAASNDYMTSGRALIIVDVNNLGKSGFESFVLEEGASLAQFTFLDSSQNYYVIGSFEIEPTGFVAGTAGGNINFPLDDIVAEGMNIALLFLDIDNPSTTITGSGDMYGIYSPLLNDDPNKNSGGQDWTVPSSTASATNIFFYTEGFMGAGYVDNGFGTLDGIVIPEPGVYAAVFGSLALVFAAYRRRK